MPLTRSCLCVLAKWRGLTHVALENRFYLYSRKSRRWGRACKTGISEILLRLHDESGRIILPDSFIPAAERYGLMTSIDRWVVENVFKVISECSALGSDQSMAMCAINLSGSTIGDEDFLQFLHEQFACYGVAPERCVSK